VDDWMISFHYGSCKINYKGWMGE